MLPEFIVAPGFVLQRHSCRRGLSRKGLILFRAGGGLGIYEIHLVHSQGRLFGIFARKIRIKIDKARLLPPGFGNNQPHLQAPVSQVNIAYHPVAQEFGKFIQGVPDNCGTQMAHMKGLCHIGGPVIYHDG